MRAPKLEMQNRRRQAAQITPLIEDQGLFKKELRQIAVTLVPVSWRNNRGDFLVKGFVSPNTEIEVVFAGRRVKEAGQLEHHLKKRQLLANRAAAGRKSGMPDVDQLRLPVQLEGSWRLRFESDESGWDIRSYQFLVSRWIFVGEYGDPLQFGRAPIQLNPKQTVS